MTLVSLELGPFAARCVVLGCGRTGEAAVVDPGDAAPVQAFLDARGLRLTAILATHHHADHVGGISALLERQPANPYYRDTRGQILLRQGRVEEALVDLEFALSRVPDPRPGWPWLADDFDLTSEPP